MNRPLVASLLALSLFLPCPVEGADATPAAVGAEIDGLLDAVASSGCTFERNGKRYPGPRARSHLERKRRYLGDRIGSAEDFIRLAATASSRSGKAYAIDCGDGAQASAEWLGRALVEIRKEDESGEQQR